MSAAHRAIVPCGAAALLAALVYANALHNPFVYDDYHTVVANASLRTPGDLRGIVLHDVTRPLVNISYAWDRAVWGTRPVGFHVTSVLLHVLNVVLLFMVVRRLVPSPAAPLAAFSASALLAVHPMMTEAVGYISGRSEVLCASLMLAGILSGLRWMRGGARRWMAATAACWIAALTAKETAAMFPFALAALDWLAVESPASDKRRRTVRLYLPMAAVATLAGLGRLWLLGVEYPGQVSFHPSYVLLELDVLRRYLWLMIHPAGQTIFHEVVPVAWVGGRALAAVGTAALLVWMVRALARRQGAASFGLAWFLLMLAPSATLAVFNQGEPMAEHRVYIASLGLFLAAGIGIAWLGEAIRTRRPALQWAAAIAFGIGLFALMVQTTVRNAVWSSPVALWQESVDLAPDHNRPRLLLGEALEDAGRREEAVAQYRTAIRLRPDDATGYVKLGLCLAGMGRIDEAKRTLRQALALDPTSQPVRRSLAILANVEPAS